MKLALALALAPVTVWATPWPDNMQPPVSSCQECITSGSHYCECGTNTPIVFKPGGLKPHEPVANPYAITLDLNYYACTAEGKKMRCVPTQTTNGKPGK